MVFEFEASRKRIDDRAGDRHVEGHADRAFDDDQRRRIFRFDGDCEWATHQTAGYVLDLDRERIRARSRWRPVDTTGRRYHQSRRKRAVHDRGNKRSGATRRHASVVALANLSFRQRRGNAHVTADMERVLRADNAAGRRVGDFDVDWKITSHFGSADDPVILRDQIRRQPGHVEYELSRSAARLEIAAVGITYLRIGERRPRHGGRINRDLVMADSDSSSGVA